MPAFTGHGNHVKAWWIDSPEASEAIRWLDDDDWVPPYAVGVHAEPLVDKDVVLSLCQMLLVAAHRKAGQQWRITDPDVKAHHAASGTVLFRTEAARKVGGPNLTGRGDYECAMEMARFGKVVKVPVPLYWYNATAGRHTASKKRKRGKEPEWEAAPACRMTAEEAARKGGYRGRFDKPIRTFRRALFGRVPTGNYLNRDGQWYVSIYDAVLMQPMGRLARRIRFQSKPGYCYDHVRYQTTPAREEVLKEYGWQRKRGFRLEGELPGSVEATAHGVEVTFVVPVFRNPERVQRCVESITRQRGDWRGIVAVDGGDVETAEAARAAIGVGGGRWTVTVQEERVYAVRNLFDAICTIPDNHVVAIVDGDDWLSREDVAEELVGRYTAEPELDVYCGSKLCWRSPKVARERVRLEAEKAELTERLRDPATEDWQELQLRKRIRPIARRLRELKDKEAKEVQEADGD